MLRNRNGYILKPATKAILGEREIAFYENLQTSPDPTIMQLKNFVPCYYGTTELKVFQKRTKFLTLKDITEDMAEPCIMDIKIGHRTWDPLATPEKRAKEEFKYAESKRAYGFCITGFQVYCLSTGRLKKFDRHYGKKLDIKGVVEALKIFLNITPERPACRQLIVKLLSVLWNIMRFFRKQRKYRFYSSSLLVAYDAKKLRHYCTDNEDFDDSSSSHAIDILGTLAPCTSAMSNASRKRNQTSSSTLKRSVSVDSSGLMESIQDDKFSNQFNCHCEFSPTVELDRRLSRSCPDQSYADFKDTTENDGCIVCATNELHDPEDKCNWVRVNMIDFTHVFPADNDSSLDLNYLEGIENLIKLIETFLFHNDDYKHKYKQESHFLGSIL